MGAHLMRWERLVEVLRKLKAMVKESSLCYLWSK